MDFPTDSVYTGLRVIVTLATFPEYKDARLYGNPMFDMNILKVLQDVGVVQDATRLELFPPYSPPRDEEIERVIVYGAVREARLMILGGVDPNMRIEGHLLVSMLMYDETNFPVEKLKILMSQGLDVVKSDILDLLDWMTGRSDGEAVGLCDRAFNMYERTHLRDRIRMIDMLRHLVVVQTPHLARRGKRSRPQ